jgi:hypothetical protein
MRWALTEATNQFHSWRLELNDFTAELKYNKKANSFRINAGDKRLFFIEKTGLLQNKFLIRTEYSVITGEIYPVRNWQSGIVILENKKRNYFVQDNLLIVSSKKDDFSIAIEINDVDKTEQEELFALLFGTVRAVEKFYKMKREPVLA